MIRPEEIERLREAAQASFLALSRTPHSAIRFVTKVLLAAVVSLDDDIGATLRQVVEQHDQTYRSALMRSGRISRSPLGQTRFSDVVEIDLLSGRIVCSAMKAALMKEFGIEVEAVRADQRIVVLHTHGVIDCRGHASPEVVARDLRCVWSGPRAVHFAKLHSEGTRAQNLSRLADYSTKFVHRYSRAWNGGKTEYLGSYEPEWRSYVLQAYHSIGYHKLIVANVKSQRIDCDSEAKMYADTRESVAESPDSEALQLTNTESLIKHNLDKPSYHCESQNDSLGETMKASEIIRNYIDPSKINQELYAEVVSALERQGIRPLTDEERYALYGSERDDIEIMQLKRDLANTEAEIEERIANAARDRAEAAKLSADEGIPGP